MLRKCNHIKGAKGKKAVEKAVNNCTDRARRLRVHVACLALKSRTQEERDDVEEISIAY